VASSRAKEKIMERFIKNPKTVLRMREGMLGIYLDTLAGQLEREGYARYTVWLQLRVVADFGRWLTRKGIAVEEITREHTKQYLQYQVRQQHAKLGYTAALKRLLSLLRQVGVIAKETIPDTPIDKVTREFGVYLQQERVLAPMTVICYVPFGGRFLVDRFAGGSKLDLSVLCAEDVVKFVQRQAPRLHLKRAKLMTTALRSFLQYARYKGYISLDLAASVPAVASWTMATIPRSLPPEHVELVLAHCNRETCLGRRDYAILMLLARLGLRSLEVASLMLEDIDWQMGRITVRGKGGSWSHLPLPVDVGEAIAAYLKNGRPLVASRSVFLRGRAPVTGFKGQQGVGSVVKLALARAGIDSPHKGAHQFRHTLATQMLSRGASLAEIGEVLRHRSPHTTQIYAKVDLASLRPLALPWPGGAK
jgi:site-specific recombinase XerD